MLNKSWLKFKLKLKKINISLFSKLVKNSIITEEKNLDYFKIKKKIISQIKKSNNINLKLNQSISKEIVKKKYVRNNFKKALIIYACYRK
mgnify:CR=1 FL=1